ncbi:MAG: hypothetical protein NTW96_17610 [Planctomycetia bacterium]|nr:hypothetical protein [Planctomycetia bacterium]
MSSSKATALGVSNSPERLGTVVGRPVWSTYATTDSVVPRSIPTGGCGRSEKATSGELIV